MALHHFQLVLDPWLGPSSDDRYDDLRREPPRGCSVRPEDSEPDRVYLDCAREAGTRLNAIAQVVSEIRKRYGLPDADDLGIEKLWEFMGDSDFSIDVIAQLTLMAARRAELIGISIDELVTFLRTATQDGNLGARRPAHAPDGSNAE